MSGLKINAWEYTVGEYTPSTVHSASTDPEEIRGLIATTYRCDPNTITVRLTK